MDESSTMDFPEVSGLEGAERRRKSKAMEQTVVELYTTMRSPLLGYAYQVVGSSGEAEDLVQIAFLKLFDQLKRKMQIDNLRSWLYRVVHNLAVDHLRRQGKQESAIAECLSQRTVETSSSSTEEKLIQRQLIARSLEALNVRERYCLMLRAEGLSYKEIAEVLSISAKAVSVYLARGLKKFEVGNEERHQSGTAGSASPE